MESITFEEFPKLPRLTRDCVITEKLDGTNAQVIITDAGEVAAASRTRLITPDQDNYGFARWVQENAENLRDDLGPGRHFGEWWGSGIQRRYGLKEKRFSMFNTHRWGSAQLPPYLHVVPVLYRGPFSTEKVDEVLEALRASGSVAAPGFMDPEGVVVFHSAAQVAFKRTLKGDEHKGAA